MRYQDLQAALAELANPSIAKHSQRYFKTGEGEYGEGDIFLGVRMPELRKQAKAFSILPLNDVLKLLHSNIHDERLAALLILVLQYQGGDHQVKKTVFNAYLENSKQVNNWDLVDCSAHHIVGAHLNDEKRDILFQLADSTLIWDRRIAMIATYYFIKRNDLETTFSLANQLRDDTEDLMHKAVGWMLREAGKRDRVRLEGFLKRHYQFMPRTMLRYAIEKFDKSERAAYLAGTV